MEIEDNLLEIANSIFKKRDNWKFVKDEQKIKWFFIINRMFSKLYPEKAQMLNLKNVDKAICMDLWFNFMKKEPYPSNFWSKSPKKEKSFPDKDYKLLLKRLKVSEFDLDYLIKNFPDFIKEELTYYKKLEKGN